MNETAIYHHGTKGMKWGIRRYQNKDGSLTALGRKREKEMSDKLKSNKKEIEALKKENETLKKTVQSTRPKATSEMSDAELRDRVNRLNMEQQYKQYVSNLYPETKSRGERFVNKVVNDVLIPAAIDVGKNTVKTMLSNAVKGALEASTQKDNKKSKNS